MNEFSQIELVWVIFRMEWECFWVNLREYNKVFESKMADIKMAAIINLSQNEWVKFFLCKMAESKMAEIKMAAISSWGRMNEWRFFLHKMAETRMAEFKIAAIIKLSLNEWVKVFLMQIVGTNLGKCEWVWEGKLRWLNANWQNSRWLALSSWVRMNEFELDWISLSRILSKERVFWVNLREDN